MFIVKATEYSESGVSNSREHLDAMFAYKKALASEGVLISAEELLPSSTGIRIMYSSDSEKPEILVGPFPFVHEMVAEFILVDVHSLDEAFHLALRMPVPKGRVDCKIEIRMLSEDDGFLHDSKTLVMEADLVDHLHMLKNI
ncbi:YciI family protein [Bacillus sp. THAF10]|uniref:YciI family protein n=1 Tax=Bacillus sp. THAF10 TaxID=2587848 RepID=UPI0020A679B7|nr:YciI family protein [Bacillus sp. THAF10]